MRIEVRDVGRGAHVEAREIAGGRTFRAPHHTVSQAGLVGELAIAAGGVLMLDEAGQFSRAAMLALKNTLTLMSDDVRPVLFLTVPGGELTPRLRDLLDGLLDGPSVEELEKGHGILGWTDGHDTIRGWLRGLESEADGEGAVARGCVAVTRFPDGELAAVLSRGPLDDDVVRGYLELVGGEEG
jgi:hypothetical protein